MLSAISVAHSIVPVHGPVLIRLPKRSLCMHSYIPAGVWLAESELGVGLEGGSTTGMPLGRAPMKKEEGC